MNFDKYFSSYLYKHQIVAIPTIGEFTLDKAIQANEAKDGEEFFPTEGISFTYNKYATVEPVFVKFIKELLPKPISLIESDIEDYALQITDWLNIGKPYTINGIGTLTKLHDGAIEFSVGKPKIENISDIVASIAQKENTYESLVAKNKKSVELNLKKLLAIFGSLILLAIVVWLGIFLYKKRFVHATKPVVVDTVKAPVRNPIQTNLQPHKESTTNIVTTDTVRYKMYFLASKYKEKADKLFEYWSKLEKINRDELIVNDTMRYRLFFYKKAVPKDTAILKDKLAIYFKHAIDIEPAQ
ncbi:MAG: hypothetical protein KBF36_10395 [Chitinophagaceae bacterium]|jgi:hypothetical protein|nr:hypothetical protein [Chitinophagaceae bacterium]MBP9741498.1 hypothetical protein [Chitinophagaceae bacterium]